MLNWIRLSIFGLPMTRNKGTEIFSQCAQLFCFVLFLGNALVGAQHHKDLVVTSEQPRRDSTDLSHRSSARICVLAICMRCFAVCLVFFSEIFYTLLGRRSAGRYKLLNTTRILYLVSLYPVSGLQVRHRSGVVVTGF